MTTCTVGVKRLTLLPHQLAEMFLSAHRLLLPDARELYTDGKRRCASCCTTVVNRNYDFYMTKCAQVTYSRCIFQQMTVR